MNEELNGVDVNSFTHLPEKSVYNYNYYTHLEYTLLGKSNDDTLTDWYLIDQYTNEEYIGCSNMSDKIERLQFGDFEK